MIRDRPIQILSNLLRSLWAYWYSLVFKIFISIGVTAFLFELFREENLLKITALLALSFVSHNALKSLLLDGLFWLPKSNDDRIPFILANIVIAGKRHDNHEALRATVQQAVDSRDLYLTAVQRLTESRQKVHGQKGRRLDGVQYLLRDIFTRPDVNLVVPRVVGVDLVGRERGIKHSDLSESMMEAFEKCILLTIHAGEDENEKSIWDAIYSLHAQRIGHGLRMQASSDLGRLIRDRRIPVELCPVSNHFTNGFFLKGHLQYVFKDYREKYLTLTIATDDPWISHRVVPDRKRCYPLSDEFLALPLLFRKKNSKEASLKLGNVSRLDVLQLIYNGFDNTFLPTRDREAILAFADIETFYVISSFDLRYRIFEASLGE